MDVMSGNGKKNLNKVKSLPLWSLQSSSENQTAATSLISTTLLFTKHCHVLQIHISVPFPYYEEEKSISKIQNAVEVQSKVPTCR